MIHLSPSRDLINSLSPTLIINDYQYNLKAGTYNCGFKTTITWFCVILSAPMLTQVNL